MSIEKMYSQPALANAVALGVVTKLGVEILKHLNSRSTISENELYGRPVSDDQVANLIRVELETYAMTKGGR